MVGFIFWAFGLAPWALLSIARRLARPASHCCDSRKSQRLTIRNFLTTLFSAEIRLTVVPNRTDLLAYIQFFRDPIPLTYIQSRRINRLLCTQDRGTRLGFCLVFRASNPVIEPETALAILMVVTSRDTLISLCLCHIFSVDAFFILRM